MSKKVSKKSYEKMKKQLEEMKARRIKISKEIGEARDHGDIRENSAYHSAKQEQGLNEMRIRDLEARFENAEVVADEKLVKSDTIALGSTFKVKALDSGEEFEYTLVPEIDADIFENKISTDSPIGDAVFGYKKGDVVEAELPRGDVKFKILQVK